MANLLLKQTKLKNAWQKRIRIIMTSAVVIMSAVLFASITLAPVIVYTYFITPSLSGDASLVDGVSPGSRRQATKLKLESYENLVTSVQYVFKSPNMVPVINSVVKDLNNLKGVRLTNINTSLEGGDNLMSISGVAQTRESIVLVQISLSSNLLVTVVDFPVSNFASNDNVYNFSVSLAVNNIDINE